MKLKLHDMTDESLSLAIAQIMNRKTVRKFFFNVLAEVATEKAFNAVGTARKKNSKM
jgi:negative regulator of genetic competence, sporulation and motility